MWESKRNELTSNYCDSTDVDWGRLCGNWNIEDEVITDPGERTVVAVTTVVGLTGRREPVKVKSAMPRKDLPKWWRYIIIDSDREDHISSYAHGCQTRRFRRVEHAADSRVVAGTITTWQRRSKKNAHYLDCRQQMSPRVVESNKERPYSFETPLDNEDFRSRRENAVLLGI